MKPLRSLLALSCICGIAVASSFAAQPAACPAGGASAAKADCGCEVKADAKVCGIDTDCCCTGEKAKGRSPAKKPAKEECGTDKCCAGDDAKAGSNRPAYGKLRR